MVVNMRLILLLFTAFGLSSCDKHGSGDREIMTTKDMAREMFRRPASEEMGKINEKFQPIDHDIKKAEDQE